MEFSLSQLLLIIVNAFSIIGAVAYVTRRFTAVELKVDTIWEYLMRRGLAEGLVKGVLEHNSPIVVTQEARSWFSSVEGELRQIYLSKEDGWDDKELMMAIEVKLGYRIMKEICIPHKLLIGACLIIAAEIAKGPVHAP